MAARRRGDDWPAGLAKRRVALRYWLLGAGYHQALDALDLAEGYHNGTRKDGVTPEFAHQIAIAHYLRTLAPHLLHPEETLTAGLLHDVREDYGVGDDELRVRFGDTVADAVDAMTKTFRGDDRDEDDVFARIAASPVASVAKAADRIHNLQTMLGVFTHEKMTSYADETEQRFLPMIREARGRFSRQEPAYENCKSFLTAQVEFVRAVVASQDVEDGG